MRALLFRWLNIPLLILLSLGILILQTTLFRSESLHYLQPEFFLIFVIWMAIKRPFFEGGVLTLVFAHLAEISSGVTSGVLYLTFILLFLITRLLHRVLLLANKAHWVIYAWVSFVLSKAFLLFILNGFGLAERHLQHTLTTVFFGACVTGVTALALFPLLSKLDWVTYKDPRARDALFEDTIVEEDSF